MKPSGVAATAPVIAAPEGLTRRHWFAACVLVATLPPGRRRCRAFLALGEQLIAVGVFDAGVSRALDLIHADLARFARPPAGRA